MVWIREVFRKARFVFLGGFFLTACAYHRPEVRVLPDADKAGKRTLFIAFDGIGYDMMKELKDEGYYSSFSDPVPLIVPFPSATTIGFTGIFKPLDVGKVPGYETRFYSFKEDKITGGTPWGLHKIPINYKTYFDAFRHTIREKSVVYSFPGVAGRQDLIRTEHLLLHGSKAVMITYLGGTDGSQHLLGKGRSKRFMIFVDRYLERMKRRYEASGGKPVRLVLFSDHGFHYDNLKMVWIGTVEEALKKEGFRLAGNLQRPKNVVLVKFGLLSAGVIMNQPKYSRKIVETITKVEGVDLAFWVDGRRIHIMGREGMEAYFELAGNPRRYRYIPVRGDPLDYLPTLKRYGRRQGEWIANREWFEMTWNHFYPDAAYRLDDAFHHLVENRAEILFSLKPDYQIGSLPALAGTKLKYRHKGTHGGLFKDVSQGVIMTDDPDVHLPQAVRYDDFFRLFLPRVTAAYARQHGKREVSFIETRGQSP